MEPTFSQTYNPDYSSSPPATQIQTPLHNLMPMYLLTYITHPLLLISALMYIQISDKSSKGLPCYQNKISINDTTCFDSTLDTFDSSSTHL